MQPRVDRRAWYVASVASAVVAVVFVGVVGAQLRRADVAAYLHQPPLAELQQALRADPQNAALKDAIRQRDLEARQQMFYRFAMSERAAWLLLGGLVTFLVSAHVARNLRRTLPDPKSWGTRRAGGDYRWAIVGCWGALVVSAVALRLPPPELTAKPAAAVEWPAFRGPTGQGIATSAPGSFAVKWKVAVPLPGMSSPVVARNRIFLTGADPAGREVFAYDARTGKLLWRQAVQTPVSGKVPDVMSDTGLAAPTPVTDGRRVYAIFANGDCAAVTVDGKPVWGRNLGLPENPYGHASSLALFQDRLLVLFAQAKGKSKVLALDTKTGNAFWQDQPLVGASWISPIVVDGQFIIAAEPEVIAYDALTGQEAWSAEAVRGELGASPIMVGDKLIVVSPHNRVVALDRGGKQLWESDAAAPDIVSPVSDGERIYLIDVGTLTVLDAATGKKVAERDLELEFRASPVWCAGRLYLFSTTGKLLVLDAQLERQAEFDVGEPIHATPAFVDKRIYVRTETQLLCLGEN